LVRQRGESFGRQLRRKTKDLVKSPHPPASSDFLKSAVPLQSMSPFPTSPPSPPQSAPTSSATSTSPSTSSSPSPPAASSQKNYRQNYRQLKRSARYHRLGEMLFTLKVLAAGNCDDEVALLEDFITLKVLAAGNCDDEVALLEDFISYARGNQYFTSLYQNEIFYAIKWTI